MPQLTIYLRPSEKDALLLLADQERRKLHDQAALIIRSELERRGMLEPFLPIGVTKKVQIKEASNA